MNTRFVGFALLIGALAVDALSQKKPLYEQLVRPEGAVLYHTPIGLCEDYPEETTTLEIIRNDMEMLKRSGIGMLRISFGWDAIEAEKDTYDWLFWDDYVRIAAEEYGITLIPYVCYTPMWNSPGDTTNFWNRQPKDLAQFGEFMFDLVTRYKKWIKSWELWNEPDITAYWNGTIEDYAHMTKLGSDAVRRADPDAMVILGGLAHDVNWTKRLFRDLGISPYVDIVNIHNYNETWSGNPNELVVDYVNAIADVVQQYGDGQSIWMAEVGYSTFRRGARVSDSYNATYDYEHTPRYQGVHLFRTLSMLLSTEKLAAIAWYEVKDLTSHEDVIGDDNNRNLGVASLTHEAKPAEAALAFFNRLFSQKVTSIDKKVIVTRTAGSESIVNTFQAEDGSVILVGWLRTAIRGTLQKGGDGMKKDERIERLNLTVPVKLKGTVTAYKEDGAKQSAPSVSTRGSDTIVNGWSLKGGEVSILHIQ